HHGIAGLCLRTRSRPAALSQSHADQAVVSRHLPACLETRSLAVLSVIAVPRLPGRQPELPLHALGQSDANGVRLAAALLSAGRGLCPELNGADAADRLGEVRNGSL